MQISEDRMIQIWGDTRFSQKIWLLNHSLDEAQCIARLLQSVAGLSANVRVLVDDRTTDTTWEIATGCGAQCEFFRWRHDFSYPKNLLTRKVPKGDWCLMLGGDMELMPHVVPEILEFIRNPGNVAAKFQIPEYAPDDRQVVTRPRTLLWRSHPMLYWERLVHEEMIFSLYRLLQIGLPFLPSQELPRLGGDNGIVHHAMNVDSASVNWRKRCYYLCLYQLDRISRRSGRERQYEEGMLEAYLKGNIPKGLIEDFETMGQQPLNYEYD
jgi:hypothetical protein